MKKWNWRRGLLGAGAVLVALASSLQGAPAFADEGRNVVLPEGVTFEGENEKYTVYYEDKTDKSSPDDDQTGYYRTLFDALCAVHMSNPGDATAEIYCKPGADVYDKEWPGYYHVADNLTIYGNGAYVNSGERCFEIDMYSYDRKNMDEYHGLISTEKSDLERDITFTVKSLDGIGLWGSRRTTHDVTVVFEDCQNMGRILQHTNYQPVGSGPNGTTNVTVKDSSFNADNGSEKGWSIQMWVGGSVNVENTTFTGIKTPIYMDNQATEKSNINLSDCTFVDCASSITGGSSPIWLNGHKGTTTEATMDGLKFEYSEGVTPGSDNAVTIGDEIAPVDTNISFTMSNTDAGIAVHEPGGTKEYDAKDTDIATGDTTNTDEPVIVICTHPAEGVKAVAKVEPSCTVDGAEAYWTCAACDEMYSDAELKNKIDEPVVIKASGHKTELQGKKDATCTAEGYTGDEVCSVCKETLKKGEATAKLDHASDKWVANSTDHRKVCDVCEAPFGVEAHEYGEWKVTEEATIDKAGSKERACEVCGYVETAELPKLEEEGPSGKPDPKPEQKPEAEPEDEGDELPQTGDASALIQLAVAASGSAALAAGAIATRKRR